MEILISTDITKLLTSTIISALKITGQQYDKYQDPEPHIIRFIPPTPISEAASPATSDDLTSGYRDGMQYHLSNATDRVHPNQSGRYVINAEGIPTWQNTRGNRSGYLTEKRIALGNGGNRDEDDEETMPLTAG